MADECNDNMLPRIFKSVVPEKYNPEFCPESEAIVRPLQFRYDPEACYKENFDNMLDLAASGLVPRSLAFLRGEDDGVAKYGRRAFQRLLVLPDELDFKRNPSVSPCLLMRHGSGLPRHVSVSKKKYGRLQIGLDAKGGPVYVYIHQLVCWALWGPGTPTRAGETMFACHSIYCPKSRACVNPLHMRWDVKANDVLDKRLRALRINPQAREKVTSESEVCDGLSSDEE